MRKNTEDNYPPQMSNPQPNESMESDRIFDAPEKVVIRTGHNGKNGYTNKIAPINNSNNSEVTPSIVPSNTFENSGQFNQSQERLCEANFRTRQSISESYKER